MPLDSFRNMLWCQMKATFCGTSAVGGAFQLSRNRHRLFLLRLFLLAPLIGAGCQPLRPPPPTPVNAAYAISEGRPYSLRVIDTDTGALTEQIPLSDYPGPSLALAPNGKVYVPIQGSPGVTGRSVAIYNPVTHNVKEVAVGRSPWAVVSSPDGKVYVINQEGGGHGTVSVIDSANDGVVNTIDIGLMPLAGAISSDGRWLYVTRDDPDFLYGRPFGLDPNPRPDEPPPAPMTIVKVDTREARVTRIAGYSEGSFPMAVTWASNKLYVALYSSQIAPNSRLKSAGEEPGHRIIVLDASSLQVIGRIEVPPRPQRMVLGPSGKLYIGHADDSQRGVTVVDTQRDQVINEITIPAGALGMATRTLLYASPFCIVDTTTDRVVVNEGQEHGLTLPGGPFSAIVGDWAGQP